MAARKTNAVATKNTEAEDFLATGQREKDYFAFVEPGLRFAVNDKDMRATLRVKRKTLASEAEDFLATGKRAKDYFTFVQPGLRFAANGKDTRVTLRVGRKTFIKGVAILAAATGLVGGGRSVSDIANIFRHAGGANKPTVQKVDVQPAIQDGTRYEFTDKSGNKMVWMVAPGPP